MVKSGVLAATVRDLTPPLTRPQPKAHHRCPPLTPTPHQVRDAALGFAAIAPTKPDHHYTRLYGGAGPPAPHLRGVAAAPSRLDGVRLGLFKAHAHNADQVRTHPSP